MAMRFFLGASPSEFSGDSRIEAVAAVPMVVIKSLRVNRLLFIMMRGLSNQCLNLVKYRMKS